MANAVLEMGSDDTVRADDGFFFGIGAFETIAVSGRAPIFLDWHMERLGSTLRYLGVAFDRVDLEDRVRRACAGLDAEGEMALKLTVTERNRLVTFRENPYVATGERRGFACDYSAVQRSASSPLAQMKTLAYAENILEKRRARERGIDEPLFLNATGEVCEGAVSNIFAVIDGEIVTSPVSCGLLPGIMRRFAIEATGAAVRPFTPAELAGASEVFFTNSLMGAMPVRRIGESVFEPGRVVHAVDEAYVREVARARRAACGDDTAARTGMSSPGAFTAADRVIEGGGRR